MKIFIDTANIEQIKQAFLLGIIDGVTTNPSIISKENIADKPAIVAHYKKILEVSEGDLSAEVIATDYRGMMGEAEELASISGRIVIKLPCTTEGIKTVKALSQKGIKTNCTLVFSLQQCLVAMKAGASYISPFIGRLEDVGDNGIQLIRETLAMKQAYGFSSEIICTSVRNLNHIKECIRAGADIVTCTYNFLPRLIEHPLTQAGLESFLKDYRSRFGEEG